MPACPHCSGTGQRPESGPTCRTCGERLIPPQGRQVAVEGHGQTWYGGELTAACPNSLGMPLELAGGQA